MRKLKLHIGLPKTGSSSIQSFLYLNVDALSECGVVFPNLYDGENSHASLVAYAGVATGLELSPFIKNFHKLHSAEDIEPFKDRFRKRFEACLVGSETKTVVMTSELFYTEVRQLEQIQALKTFLSEYFSDIEIIAYVRSQEDWISSRLSQIVKLGSLIDLNRLMNSRFNNYFGMLQPWWKTFGLGQFHLRVLEKEKLVGNDLISDFLDLIMPGEAPDFEMPERQNQGLSVDAIDFLQGFNKHIPYFLEDKTVNPERNGLTEYMEEYSQSNPGNRLSEENIKILQDKFEPSNERLRKLFFPKYDTLFRSKDKIEPGEAGHDKDPTKISAYLWSRQQEKLFAMKDKIEHLEAVLESRITAIEREGDTHRYKIISLEDANSSLKERLASLEDKGFWKRLFKKPSSD